MRCLFYYGRNITPGQRLQIDVFSERDSWGNTFRADCIPAAEFFNMVSVAPTTSSAVGPVSTPKYGNHVTLQNGFIHTWQVEVFNENSVNVNASICVQLAQRGDCGL